MYGEAICGECRGCGGVAFVGIVLLLGNRDLSYGSVYSQLWIKDVVHGGAVAEHRILHLMLRKIYLYCRCC